MIEYQKLYNRGQLTFEQKVDYASMQLATRILRLKNHAAGTYTYEELAEVLGGFPAVSLRRYACREHYASRLQFLDLVRRLYALELTEGLPALDQISPWESNAE